MNSLMPSKIIPTSLSTNVSKFVKNNKSMTVYNIFMKSLEPLFKQLKSRWKELTLFWEKDLIKMKSTLMTKWLIILKSSKSLIIQLKFVKWQNHNKLGNLSLTLPYNCTTNMLTLIFQKMRLKSSSLLMAKSWNILLPIARFHIRLIFSKISIKISTWEVKWPKLSLQSSLIFLIQSTSCS